MNYPLEDLRAAILSNCNLSQHEKTALTEYLDDYDYRCRYPQEIGHGYEVACPRMSEEEAMLRHLQARDINFESVHPDLNFAIQKAAAVMSQRGM